jgi:hypothetical protein
MVRLLTIIALIGMIGCNWQTMFDAPPDFHYDPPEPVEQDTVPTDTIVVPVDTCTFPEEIQEPQFCIAYHEITDDLQTDRVVIIGNNSFVWAQDLPNVEHMIDSLWELYKPQYSYQTFISDNDSRRLITIIKGTNDRQQFYLHAQIRYNGLKHYFGFDTKTIFPFDAITVDEFSQLIDEYPSVYRFNFIRTEYSQEDYIKLSLKILGYCKSGDWADFRFNPIPIPDSIPAMFIASHWNTVLHGPDIPLFIDLRHMGYVPESMLYNYDCRSQIITRN